MKYNILLTIFSVIAMADGLAAIFAPGTFINVIWPHGTGPGAYLFLQGWGACLIVFSVMAWAAKSLTESSPRLLFALGFFIYHLIATMVFLVDGLSKSWTPLSVTILVTLALFTLGFGYFRFLSPASV